MVVADRSSERTAHALAWRLLRATAPQAMGESGRSDSAHIVLRSECQSVRGVPRTSCSRPRRCSTSRWAASSSSRIVRPKRSRTTVSPSEAPMRIACGCSCCSLGIRLAQDRGWSTAVEGDFVAKDFQFCFEPHSSSRCSCRLGTGHDLRAARHPERREHARSTRKTSVRLLTHAHAANCPRDPGNGASSRM